MTLLSFITFFTTMFIIVAVPGPGTFAIASKSLSNNLSSVSFIIFGMIIADIIFLLFAIFGLSAVASLMGDFFVLIKYLGALYLFYLGYKLFTSKVEHEDMQELKSSSWLKNFLLGFVITFSNPKVIIFYMSLLPVLVNVQSLTFVDMSLLALCVTAVISIVMFSYAFLGFKAKDLFKSLKARKRMNKIAASAMIGAGGVMLAKA